MARRKATNSGEKRTGFSRNGSAIEPRSHSTLPGGGRQGTGAEGQAGAIRSLGNQVLGKLLSTGALLRRLKMRTQLAVRDWQEEREKDEAPPNLLILKERHQDLLDFYTHFESLVEMLCDAAQRGANQKTQERYEEERNWIQTHYFMVRPYIAAYLSLDSEDAEHSLSIQGFAGDAFQTLCASPSLEALVKSDDGNMISRIIRCREALTLYANHLRQLIGREKACS